MTQRHEIDSHLSQLLWARFLSATCCTSPIVASVTDLPATSLFAILLVCVSACGGGPVRPTALPVTPAWEVSSEYGGELEFNATTEIPELNITGEEGDEREGEFVQSSATQHDTLLLIHGLGESASADWQPIRQALAPHFMAVLSPDLPGFGASDPGGHTFHPEDYAALIIRRT